MIYIKKASKRFVGILLLLSLLLSFCSCTWSWEEYALSTNWHCTKEEFIENYLPLYVDKVEELKAFYDVECVLTVDILYYYGINICLYNEVFTADMFLICRDSHATISSNLYFYGNESTLFNYNAQKVYVDLINDFVNYVAFDTKADENRFASLYLQSMQKEEKCASDHYHFDELVGYVGYSVDLDKDTFGNYYMCRGDFELETRANCFSFEGLLKPLY